MKHIELITPFPPPLHPLPPREGKLNVILRMIRSYAEQFGLAVVAALLRLTRTSAARAEKLVSKGGQEELRWLKEGRYGQHLFR